MGAAVHLDLDLLPALAKAVDDAALVLHYQPEVDLASGSVVGMEALLRWQHPTRGLLWPADFLGLAESAALLPDIGRWVFASCLREAIAWSVLPGRQRAIDWQLWINVSGSQLADPEFVAEITAALTDAGLPPRRLGLEITERGLEVLGRHANDVLGALREAGFALAIDDFGTWYSSLATIGDLPVDSIKLDRSFVRGVGSDIADDEIVAAVIKLAHARGLTVVAEGVESWSEGARLCELGCDRAHGYLFSGPQRADKARLMLARGFGWSGVAESTLAAPGGTTGSPPDPRRPAP